MTRVVVGGWSLREIVHSILEEEMGELHAYYALEALRAGGLAAVVYDPEPVGAEVFYTLPGVCVHYYVCVVEGRRGRGYGRVLVASVEEYCGSQGSTRYVATTTIDNRASCRLFESLGYTGYTWREIAARVGEDGVDMLLKLTCGYEDDVVYIKPAGLEELIELLEKQGRRLNRLWRRMCYEPWLRLWLGYHAY